jgi:hypothetical protein
MLDSIFAPIIGKGTAAKATRPNWRLEYMA